MCTMVGPHLSLRGHLLVLYISSFLILCLCRFVSSYVTPPLGMTRATFLVFAQTSPFLSLNRCCMVSFCTSSLYMRMRCAHTSHLACFRYLSSFCVTSSARALGRVTHTVYTRIARIACTMRLTSCAPVYMLPLRARCPPIAPQLPPSMSHKQHWLGRCCFFPLR